MKDLNDTYSEPKMTAPFTIHESVKSLREGTSQSSFAVTQLREFVKQIFSIIRYCTYGFGILSKANFIARTIIEAKCPKSSFQPAGSSTSYHR